MSFPYARWAGLVVLLTAEALVVSFRFDMLVPTDRPWASYIKMVGPAGKLCLAIALAALLVWGPQCYGALKEEAGRLVRSRRAFLPILCNLLAFVLFYGLSISVLEGTSPWHPSEWALVAVWVLAGLAIVVSWGLAIFPLDLWVAVVRRSGWSLAAGVALGVTAFEVGLLAKHQWRPLSGATLQLVQGLLGLVYSHIVCVPNDAIVGTDAFQVEISSQCSGYEGMGLIAALVSIALWIFRRDFRFPRAYALLPLAIALLWFANGVRIAALVAMGTRGYSKLAIGGFHSVAGWVFFLVIGLGLIACARRLPFFSSLPSNTESRRAGLDGAYLMPAMAVIATAMITSTFSPGFDRYYAARVIAAMAILLYYRESYAELRPVWSWEAAAIGCGVFALWMALEPQGVSESAGLPVRSGLESLGPVWATIWLIFRVVGSVFTVPLAEELAFRGYLTRRLRASEFESVPPGRMTWWTLLVSSLLFGALHGRWVAGSLAGIAYGLAYRRRGELTDAVLAHGVTNALIALTVLTTGAWSLWS